MVGTEPKSDERKPRLPGLPSISGVLFSVDPLAGQETLGKVLDSCFGGHLPAPALATASILYPLPVLSPDAFGQEQPARTPTLMRLPFAYLPASVWVRLPFESAPVYQTRLLIALLRLGLVSEDNDNEGEGPRFVSPFAAAGVKEPAGQARSQLLDWFDHGRTEPNDVAQSVRDRAKACWPGGYNPVTQSDFAREVERQAARGVLPLQAQRVVALSRSGRPADRARAHEIFDQLRSQYAAPQGSAAASVFNVSPLLDRDELSQWVSTHRGDASAYFDWLTQHHLSPKTAQRAVGSWQAVMAEEDARRQS